MILYYYLLEIFNSKEKIITDIKYSSFYINKIKNRKTSIIIIKSNLSIRVVCKSSSYIDAKGYSIPPISIVDLRILIYL